MKRLFYQIKNFNFCRKIDNDLRLLNKIEKAARKNHEEIRRASYLNYLKIKEKGLLTKEYIEQEYKNLEDIIFNRIQISTHRRNQILKNLTDENFKNLKIDPKIIEELKKYKNSTDNSPFKVKSNFNCNIDSNGINFKISDFLNENFSKANTEQNSSTISNYLTKESNNIIKKKDEGSKKKFNRKVSLPEKKIYTVLRIDQNKNLIEKNFSEEINQIDQKNYKFLNFEEKDKAFFEYFNKKLNKEFSETQRQVEKLKYKNIKGEKDRKFEELNKNTNELGMLAKSSPQIKMKISRKSKFISKLLYQRNTVLISDSHIKEVNEIEENFEGSLINNPNSKVYEKEEILKNKTNMNQNENLNNNIDDILIKFKEKDKKENIQQFITEETLIEKYLKEMAEEEKENKSDEKITDNLNNKKANQPQKIINYNFENNNYNTESEVSEGKLHESSDKENLKNNVSNEKNKNISCKKVLFKNDDSKNYTLDSINLNEYEDYNNDIEEEKPLINPKKILINSHGLSNKNYKQEYDYSKEKFTNKVFTNPEKNSKINNNALKEKMPNENKNIILSDKANTEPDEIPNLQLEKITQINLREVNLNENYLIKPTAKTLPYLKKEIIYNHDQLQIITSLKTVEFKIKNIPKLIDILSIIRRKKKFKTYDLPEISNAINYISNYISAENNSIPASYIVNFLYTLSDMQRFDEERPSLSNDLIVYEILDKLVPKLNTLDNRSISNLLFSLQKYQIKNSKVFNFTDFLDKIEELVVKKFSTENFSNICLSQTVVAYSKCQAGSEEFYRIFADLINNKRNILDPREISIILYSYSNNINCNEKLLILLENDVIEKINKFNSIELCNIARAYDRKKILNEKLKRLIINAFIEKHENIKMLDLSYLYKILANSEEKTFLKYSHSLINSLSHDIDAISLVNFMSRADLIQIIDKNLLSLLKKITIKLIDKKQIKGYELKKIYEYVKEIPYDGKYNTFLENIVRQLEKLKYY